MFLSTPSLSKIAHRIAQKIWASLFSFLTYCSVFNYSVYKGCSESNASYFLMLSHNVRGGCMAVKPLPVCEYSITVVAMWQMAAEGHSDKMASNTEAYMKQNCVIEFLHVEKLAPTDIHWRLLNVYEDQTVDVNTVRWCISAMTTTTVGHLCWWQFLQAWHAGSSSCWQKSTDSGGDCWKTKLL